MEIRLILKLMLRHGSSSNNNNILTTTKIYFGIVVAFAASVSAAFIAYLLFLEAQYCRSPLLMCSHVVAVRLLPKCLAIIFSPTCFIESDIINPGSSYPSKAQNHFGNIPIYGGQHIVK
jgi:hypothetical protein